MGPARTPGVSKARQGPPTQPSLLKRVDLDGLCLGMPERLKSLLIKQDAEYSLSGHGFLQPYLSTMLLGDVLRQGESKADSVFLAGAHEGLKECFPDGISNPRTRVTNADFDPVIVFHQSHCDPGYASAGLGGLNCVEYQVVEGAGELLAVNPGIDRAGNICGDGYVPAFRVLAYVLDGALDQAVDRIAAQIQHLTCLAEQKQRFNEVGHALHSLLDLKMQLCALLSAGLGKAHEFGIGVDSREMVTKIVGYGAGHPADGGQTIRLQKLAVGTLKLSAHSVKGQRELTDLRGAIQAKLIIKIASTERAGAGAQCFQRPRYRARYGNCQHQANEQGGQAERHDPPVDTAQVFTGAIVRFENYDLNPGLPGGGESGGSRDVGLSGHCHVTRSRSPIESGTTLSKIIQAGGGERGGGDLTIHEK